MFKHEPSRFRTLLAPPFYRASFNPAMILSSVRSLWEPSPRVSSQCPSRPTKLQKGAGVLRTSHVFSVKTSKLSVFLTRRLMRFSGRRPNLSPFLPGQSDIADILRILRSPKPHFFLFELRDINQADPDKPEFAVVILLTSSYTTMSYFRLLWRR